MNKMTLTETHKKAVIKPVQQQQQPQYGSLKDYQAANQQRQL